MTPDELLVQAKRRIQVADHFLTQTYPLVQDPKLLVNVLDGILKAIEDILDALLRYEREAERIPVYHEGNLTAKLSLIRGELARRYDLGHLDVAMVHELQELLHTHKDSVAEFSRKGQYVIAGHEYKLQTVSVEKVKTYLTRAKALFQKVHDTIRTA